jgi:hypothetical protein
MCAPTSEQVILSNDPGRVVGCDIEQRTLFSSPLGGDRLPGRGGYSSEKGTHGDGQQLYPSRLR